MIIVCPRCGILYSVHAAALTGEPQIVQCSNCSSEWLHTPETALPDSSEALRLLALSLGQGPGSGHGQSPHAPAHPHSPYPSGAHAGLSRQRGIATDPTPPARPASASNGFEDTEDEAATGGDARRLDPVDEEPDIASSSDDRRASEKRDWASGDDHARSAAASPQAPSPATLAVSAASSGGFRKQRLAEEPESGPASALGPAAAAGDASIPPAPFGDDAIRSQPSSRVPDRRPRMAAVAIGAVAATVLISVGLLAATRDAVIAAFPGAAGVYSAVGLAASDAFAEGLEIRSVSSTRSWNDGGQVLTVAGDLANTAQKPRALPMVRVVLVDKSNAEVQEVVVRPPGETLPVGKSVRFEAQITDPAESAERIKVSLAPRPAAS